MTSNSPSSNTLIDIGTTKESNINQNENNNLERYIWKSFCFEIDRRVVIFFSQFSIGLMVISFSLYQLNKDNSCDHQQIYIGLLTMMVGIFLPAPRIQK
jgi:hypothetical protein